MVLTVFDNSVPPLYASQTRFVRVVSPCAGGETYCPEIPSQLCGTAPCSLRTQLADPPPQQPPVVSFGNAVIPAIIARDGGVAPNVASSLDMAVMCGNTPSPPLKWCTSDGSVDCVIRAEWPGGSAAELVQTSFRVAAQNGRCSEQGISVGACGECSLEALNGGHCHAGTHVYIFQAFTATGAMADVSRTGVRVAILQRLAAIGATVTGTIDAAGLAGVQLAAVVSAFGGQGPLTNELLWAARDAIHAELRAALAEPVCAALVQALGTLADALHVEVRRTAAPLSAISATVPGEDRVSVQVRRHDVSV